MAAPPGLTCVGNMDKLTVERTYLNSLVRRASLHDPVATDPASITISRVEYDNLLRVSHDYQTLRNALIMGGADANTLDILINPSGIENRKDSAVADDRSGAEGSTSQTKIAHSNQDCRTFSDGAACSHQATSWRQISYGGVSVPNERIFEDDNEYVEENANANATRSPGGSPTDKPQRTLYFSGLSDRTTYKNLLSVVKGGKIVSVVLRNDSAVVTFASGAAEFLAWSKRNEIYIQGKRIEVKWADHQFHVHDHIMDKIANGVTRNVLVHHAAAKGLDEQRIRDDMEHISNLIIVDIQYKAGHAYVYTNSVGYAMFARTCMVSRAMYKGCRVNFFEDECDVALPQTRITSGPPNIPATKKFKRSTVTNRFGLLNTEGTEASSDEENHDPSQLSEFDEMTDVNSELGARFNFS